MQNLSLSCAKPKYYPATYKNNSRAYVEYYVLNVNSGRMVRKVIKLNRIKKASERKKIAMELCNTINAKLAQGWNPLLESTAAKGSTKLVVAMDHFLDHVNKMVAKKELRPDTLRAYRSFINQLKSYFESKNILCYTFALADIKGFLIELENKATGARTYNNYITFIKLLNTWLVDRGYMAANIAKELKKKRVKQKTRQVLKPMDLEKYLNYAHQNNFGLFTASLVVLYCFIRPHELLQLKVSNLDIENKCIHVPGPIAKNGNSAKVQVPDHVLQYLIKLVENCPEDYFLFGKKLMPTLLPCNAKKLNYEFNTAKAILKFPKEYQFYSLKDTGITSMLESGMPSIKVRNQARHSSIAITDIYAANLGGVDQEINLFKIK
jgi:site-specific recombinase XerD